MQITANLKATAKPFGIALERLLHGQTFMHDHFADMHDQVNFEVRDENEDEALCISYKRQSLDSNVFVKEEAVAVYNKSLQGLAETIKADLPQEITTQEEVIEVAKAVGLALAKVNGFELLECPTPELLADQVEHNKAVVIEAMKHEKSVDCVDTAYHYLELLVAAGIEYPDAESKVLDHFKQVDQEDLTAQYDTATC